jgi:hypothetical protein
MRPILWSFLSQFGSDGRKNDLVENLSGAQYRLHVSRAVMTPCILPMIRRWIDVTFLGQRPND